MLSVVKEVLMLVNQISDVKHALISHGLVREIYLLENTFITFFSTALFEIKQLESKKLGDSF